MAKVVAIHTLDLRPGVPEEEFERFMREQFLPVPMFPGWKLSLLKGDQGERAGKYIILAEIDSVQAHDRYFPGDDQQSAEAQAFMAQPNQAKVWAELEAYTTAPGGVSTTATDYVLLS